MPDSLPPVLSQGQASLFPPVFWKLGHQLPLVLTRAVAAGVDGSFSLLRLFPASHSSGNEARVRGEVGSEAQGVRRAGVERAWVKVGRPGIGHRIDLGQLWSLLPHLWIEGLSPPS